MTTLRCNLYTSTRFCLSNVSKHSGFHCLKLVMSSVGGKRPSDVNLENKNVKKRRSDSVGVRKKSTDMGNNLRELKVYRFAKSRASELGALMKNVEQIGGTRVVFQKLPRHMRRRAMSHNIKRLPRRVREAALIEYKNIPKAAGKVPSRKHRRRPKNLLSDYMRRQRRIKWLETHIWHAKRFHMTEKWGYRLPLSPTDRSYRSCYRASNNHCLLQDVSFECCIDVKGPESVIISAFSHLLNQATGSTLGGAAVVKGNRVGENILYKYDQYPHQPVAMVTFMWRPTDLLPESKDRQLWLWCHPSCYHDVWAAMLLAFEQELLVKKMDISDTNFDKHVKIGAVTLTSLKDNLVKFRLTGGLSQTILIDALKPADLLCEGEATHWWQKYYSDKFLQQHQKQVAVWEDLMSCQSSAEAPPNMVLSLTVKDPRLLLPEMKTKIKPALEGLLTTGVKEGKPSSEWAQSPLWDASIRQDVKSTKLSESDLNKIRSNRLVPGTPVSLGEDESRIPVILVQRPGVRGEKCNQTRKLGFGSGWDVILPSGWGMAFHIAFVYRGGRTAGLQEAESLSAEMGRLASPTDFPDSIAGIAEQKEISDKLEEKHKLYPPDKKPNFVKLGTFSPFSCPWEQLSRIWLEEHRKLSGNIVSDGDSEICVLRDKKSLRLIAKTMDSISTKQNKPASNSKTLTDNLKQLETLVANTSDMMVPVNISMISRGVPSRFAGIYIPSSEDIANLTTDGTYSGPRETPHVDVTKLKKKQGPKTSSETKSSKTKDIACLPLGLDANDRRVVGFVNSGRFVFVQGQGSGIGFCSLIGLLYLLKSVPIGQTPKVLVRNTTSLQYRFAEISVL